MSGFYKLHKFAILRRIITWTSGATKESASLERYRSRHRTREYRGIVGAEMASERTRKFSGKQAHSWPRQHGEPPRFRKREAGRTARRRSRIRSPCVLNISLGAKRTDKSKIEKKLRIQLPEATSASKSSACDDLHSTSNFTSRRRRNPVNRNPRFGKVGESPAGRDCFSNLCDGTNRKRH